MSDLSFRSPKRTAKLSHQKRAFPYAIVVLLAVITGAEGQDLPAPVAAVQKYILEKDYPEVFDEQYKTKIQNVVVADLDGDGQAEVIVHYKPHYRQSPPIVIYRVAPDLNVSRVLEGLAPGPLVPLTGDYLDSHTLGEAADLDLARQQNDAAARRKFVAATLAQGASLVEFQNFFHFDSRHARAGTYIDMTGLTKPPASKDCGNFEFSPVQSISAGQVSALGGGNLLAAWAGGKVYLYRIKFPASGLLDKQSWAVDVASDFRGFAPGAIGPLRYETTAGQEKPFIIRCRDNQCTQEAS